jgi:glycosyltransferase involved in cell wall biosynthesis
MKNEKIKILQFICSTGFYGAERWVLALSNHLPTDTTESMLATTLEENSTDLELVKQFKAQCGKTFEVPMKHKFDLSVVDKLADIITRENIDIIHTHGYKSDILGVLAARKTKIKCVVTPHGFENAKDIKLRTFIWLGCQAMKFGDAVVPLSRQLLEDMDRLGVKRSKITYIQNGVDLSEVERVRTDPTISATTEKRRVGFIGQMISRKNIDDILTIFDELHQQGMDIELVFLGDGDERARLESLASTLASHADIHFLGFRDDRLALLKTFDLFVMTSTLEGVPRCLMEACAMGIPVAAYNIPGIDQLISHEKTGLLANLGDKDTLKGYWQRMLSDSIEAEEFGKNAKTYVEQHFSAQRMADEYLELFKTLLK